MQLPLAYLNSAVVEEVPVELWRDVFEATGWPESLATKRTSFSHGEVVHALAHDNLTDNLLQALETLHRLGTDTGRESILSVMNDQRVPLDTLPTNTGEKEFALHLFLAQRGNASLSDVFVRAQMNVQEGSEHRRFNEFMGKKASGISHLVAANKKLTTEILRFCSESDLGEHVQVNAFEDDGAFVFTILRSHRKVKPLAVVPGRDTRATIEYRPVHCDILRYESSVGRLRVATRAAMMVEFYREVLGRLLFNDEFFFDGVPVCSLRVLQERGRTALESHGVFSVGRIWMTECLWEQGDRNLFHIRSTDCFRSIEEQHLQLGEGQLLQAKLKVELTGKSTRPVTVNIRVPSRIEISQPIHEHLIEKLLNAIGIRNSVPGASGNDLWSLAPWRHSIQVWRTVFGAEMDGLVEFGALSPVQLESVPHPEHQAAGRVLHAEAVGDGEFYGISDLQEIPGRTLSATDLDGLELNPEKFRNYLRSRMGISRGGVAWDNRELLDLGIIEVGGHHLHAVYALRQPAAGLGDQIRTRANGAYPVLLIPSSQVYTSELAKILLESVLPTRSEVIRGGVNAYNLAEVVPAIHLAPDGARLVVDTRLKQVWIDTVEVRDLAPDSHPFRLVELLARRSPTPVSAEEIKNTISKGRLDGDLATRQAKSKARSAINKAMAEAGCALDDDPFPTAGTGFYKCALPAYVR